MSSLLDMSLDDIINTNKKSAAAGGGGGTRGRRGWRGRGFGGPVPFRHFPSRSSNRPAPYFPKAPDSAWKHDLYVDQTSTGFGAAPVISMATAIETGIKLCITNLDYGVSNEDIKELFSEVGDLKRFSIHCDRSGRSKGTAEVVFSRRSEATAAVRRYNNVELDGKPMQIEIVGTNISTPAAPMVPNDPPMIPNGFFGNLNGSPKSDPARGGWARGGFTGWPRGGRGRGKGQGRGKGRNEQISVTDLDADLDKYRQGMMQIN